jgi:O-antigen/teichoic acid export membrane protein
MDYHKAAIKGITWHSINRIGSKILSVAKVFIVAKFLSPAEVGTVGLAFLVLSLLEVFSETGFNQAAVQDQSDLLRKVPALRVTYFIRGLVLSLILLAVGPVVDNYFHIKVSPLITILAVVPFIKGLVNPNLLSLAKNLAFRRDSLYQLLCSLFENLTIILLVIYLKNPVAIVYATIVGAIFSVTLSYLFAPTTWKFNHLDEIKKLFNYGKWVTGGSVVSYLNDQIDDFTVAKLLGPESLGFYQTSFKISTLPTTQGSSLLYQVYFPLLSKLKTEKAKLKTTFLQVQGAAFVLSLVSIALIVLLSPWFVSQFLGSRWLPIIPAIYAFTLYGLVRANTSFASVLFDAVGKPNVVFVGNLIKLAALILTLVPLTLKYSYVGSAISVSLSQLVIIPWFYIQVRKTLR